MENIHHKFHAEVLIIEKNVFTYDFVRTIVDFVAKKQGTKIIIQKQVIEDYMWPLIDEIKDRIDRKYNNSNNNIQLKD